MGIVLAVTSLVAMAVLASAVGRLGTGRAVAVAAVRALGQLALVALVITVVLRSLAWSVLFCGVMFAIAVLSTSRRVGAHGRWAWVAIAVGAGVLPVLVTIFATRAVPFNGPSLVPFAGIIIGGTMNAHSLAGRRVFTAVREQWDVFEAALGLGMRPRDAVDAVARRHLPDALLPGLDQTRTVGLVTLPGAFVGVLLGGGTPVQAAAAQVLVLVGLMAAQTITVVVGYQLIRTGRIAPHDLAPATRGG